MGKLSMDLYIKKLSKRYKASSKSEKSLMLKEFCETSGYHKKHVIRLLNAKQTKKPYKKKQGRPKIYPDKAYLEPLKRIWFLCDQLCGKRLKMALPLWLPFYANEYGQLTDEIYQGLLTMSPATIDRLLKQCRVRSKRRLCGTKPGSILKKQIPIQTDQWNEAMPGYMEADTVAHCGTTLSGDFVWSLTMTDIYSGWTELRAVWNKGATGIVAQIEHIEQSLPFAILGFDCDNGSEFLNWHLIRYFSDQDNKHRVQFTRSRPYHSNDNAHVEQKNWTHVRQLFGYDRFDKKNIVALMNDLYVNEISLMNNYFLPNFKLIEKERIDAKIVKKHSAPQTPYQRLMLSSAISAEKKEELTMVYYSLNPFTLHKAVQKKLKKVFSLVDVKSYKKMGYI